MNIEDSEGWREKQDKLGVSDPQNDTMLCPLCFSFCLLYYRLELRELVFQKCQWVQRKILSKSLHFPTKGPEKGQAREKLLGKNCCNSAKYHRKKVIASSHSSQERLSGYSRHLHLSDYTRCPNPSGTIMSEKVK